MNDIILNMLRDAYSMELALMPVLEAQINDSIDDAEAHQKLLDHLEQSRVHSRLVKEQIERIGGARDVAVGNVDGAISNFMTAIQGLSDQNTIGAEKVQNVISGITIENFEIATYDSLIAAAEEAGDQELISCCEKILADEKGMELWLTEQLPVATKKYIQNQQ